MQKSESRVLGMELAGFNPLDHFSPEQVKKMRNMEPEESYYSKWTTIQVDRCVKDNIQEAHKKSDIKLQGHFVDLIIKLGLMSYEKLQV